MRTPLFSRAAIPVAMGLLLSATCLTPARSAELRVISAGAVRSIIGGMIEQYQSKTGQRFNFTVGPTGQLRGVIASGEPADLIIASAPLMSELEKTGKMTPGSRVDLGRIGLGVVTRVGAPVPDLSTAEAFKQALISAKLIAYTDPALGGTSVVHLMKLAKDMDITDIVTKKAVFASGGDDAAKKVADGKADIAIVLISEIGNAEGAKLAGPLPEALQLYTIYAAAIPASSTDPVAARAFVTALNGPELRDRWTAAGWKPAAP